MKRSMSSTECSCHGARPRDHAGVFETSHGIDRISVNSPTSTEESRPVTNVQAYLMTVSSKSMTSVNRHTPICSIKFPDLANFLLNVLQTSSLGVETDCIPHRNDFGTVHYSKGPKVVAVHRRKINHGSGKRNLPHLFCFAYP